MAVHVAAAALMLPQVRIGAADQAEPTTIYATLVRSAAVEQQAGSGGNSTPHTPLKDRGREQASVDRPPGVHEAVGGTAASTPVAEDVATSAASSPPAAAGVAPPMFQAALRAHIYRFLRYPEEARRDQRQGVVVVAFAMDRQGGLIDVWVDRSSGTASLDEEALATVRRARPLPPVPTYLPSPYEAEIPLSFALR